MMEQARQIESRDEELTALRQNYARLRKNFKDLRGTVEELPKATLPTNDLPLLYLNKLQEIREDVDHAIREYREEETNARTQMENTLVDIIQDVKSELLQGQKELWTQVGETFQKHGEEIKNLQAEYKFLQHAQDLGKNIEVQARNPAPPTPPPPQPVNPSLVASRSRRQAALDRGIAAVEAAQLNLNPFSVISRLAIPPTKKNSTV